MAAEPAYQHDQPALRLDGFLHKDGKPDTSGYLSVDSSHEIYFELSGRVDGVPVVILHGGPGTGISPIAHRFFDPSFFRLIRFDQRGSGRSRPAGSLAANTTEHLIADMETLRTHLEISSWVVFGGSWGATLALAYGIAYPARCLGFLLRSVALGRASEFRWWARGMRQIFPESWHRFAGHVGAGEDDDLLEAYASRLQSEDDEISTPAAVEWHRYAASCGTLFPSNARKLDTALPAELVNMARIEAHYFRNNAFLADNWILDNRSRIAHLPASIVHGRYDIISPVVNSYELARTWPSANLRIVDGAGHLLTEYALAETLFEEAERIKAWFLSPACMGHV